MALKCEFHLKTALRSTQKRLSNTSSAPYCRSSAKGTLCPTIVAANMQNKSIGAAAILTDSPPTEDWSTRPGFQPAAVDLWGQLKARCRHGEIPIRQIRKTLEPKPPTGRTFTSAAGIGNKRSERCERTAEPCLPAGLRLGVRSHGTPVYAGWLVEELCTANSGPS